MKLNLAHENCDQHGMMLRLSSTKVADWYSVRAKVNRKGDPLFNGAEEDCFRRLSEQMRLVAD